jgi:dUTP pyrophosphatase
VSEPTLTVPTTITPGATAPTYAMPGDGGADLTTTIALTIAPGGWLRAPTGVGIALPEGYAAFVVPRSGLAARHALTVVNAPGLIDSGYRGEIHVILQNGGRETVELAAGDRIAQLVVQRVERVQFQLVRSLPGSARGAGGFGSTGGFFGVFGGVDA